MDMKSQSVIFCFLVAAGLLAGLCVRHLTGDRLAGLVSGLLLLAFPYVLHWAPLDRVDTLALALGCAGMYRAVRWPRKRWTPLVSALLLVAAVYARQSHGLAAPLAVIVWIWHQAGRGRGLQTVGWFAGVGGLV